MGKAQSTAIAKYDARLAELAKKSAEGEKLPTSKFFSLKGGQLTFGGADVEGNKIRCIVVAHTRENQHFEGDYSPDTPQVPSCYAFGKNEEDMQPHEQAEDKQADSCGECPLNEWGSNPKGGDGKGCKNVRRLAVIDESDLDNLDKAEMAFLKVPVTSAKNWSAYVKKTLEAVVKRPSFAVITEISVKKDPKDQFKVHFELVEKINDTKLLDKLEALAEKTEKTIGFPYVVQDNQKSAKRSKAKGGKAAKNAPKKKSKFGTR